MVVVEKALGITYSGCVSLASIIQSAERMRHIILLSVACPTVPYFSTLSHKRHDFREKKLLTVKCMLYFSITLSETFLILKGIQ
jgi:hypothetical protein